MATGLHVHDYLKTPKNAIINVAFIQKELFEICLSTQIQEHVQCMDMSYHKKISESGVTLLLMIGFSSQELEALYELKQILL